MNQSTRRTVASDPSDPTLVLRALESRLARLETGARRARLCAVGSLAALAVVTLGGFAPFFGAVQEPVPPADGLEDEAETEGAEPAPASEPADDEEPLVAPEPEPLRELVLTDEAGRRRVWLGTRKGGSCGLGLYDAVGTARSELFLTAEGESRLMLSDRRGRPRAYVGVGEEGAPLVRLADREGRPVLEAGIDPMGATRVRVVDPATGRVVELHVLEDGRPGLFLGGREGIEHVSLGLSTTDAPGLRMRDERGRVVFERP
ncbi:hypothetical protein Pla163_15770 [Planctomycetes bacterium Pla163]|uniref:Uncharacterized protein n=1 Tax=Rohdeia mirabilis TaxID=2528008 RepID=A0A518CZ27_9BACT|nr:hypothetical protein Pla163_15770 [Planctomycetes bacterium Pla163]